jgi:D-glycerate 3-kinase
MTLPFDYRPLEAAALETLGKSIKEPLINELTRQNIEHTLISDLDSIYLPLADFLYQATKSQAGSLVVGVNGAQGAGKSTLCKLLKIILEQGFDLRVCGFSIDDIYLTRAERCTLAKTVHPLLLTRGVPGTHDVAMGCQLLDQLRVAKAHRTIEIPLFNKALDDRYPRSEWLKVSGPFDLILFEGWCVGAKPQDEKALRKPINSLEKNEDPDGIWRRYVNWQLKDNYARLFVQLDFLVMLKVPNMESVFRWRSLQESKLAASVDPGHCSRIMSPSSLETFLMHYERLTQSMLEEMPTRADVVLAINQNHRIDTLSFRQ